jgi:EAL domain-containing protein (putative c-di-GMP-specific phosphodiesterase class I)
MTEHAAVEEYETLQEALAQLRERGIRVAVDDTGAGFASLRHILQLSPEFVKLDISLTRGIAKDPPRRALAAALTAFANELGASIIAEGVEREEELTALAELRVHHVQGYLLGRPGPL